MASFSDSCKIFDNLSAKISQLLYSPTKDARIALSKTLEDLICLNYRYPVVTNATKAVLLINQCCSLIPPEDKELVLKCCQLITNLLIRQNVIVEGRTQVTAVQWCLQALRQETAADADILVALEALLRSSTKNNLITEVVKSESLIKQAKNNNQKPKSGVIALQCLEACTQPQEDRKLNDDKFPNELQLCFGIFLDNLQHHHATQSSDQLIDNLKSLSVCLRGIQNIVLQQTHLLGDNLGIILGIIKSYMLYNLKDIDFLPPNKLMPSTLSIPEPLAHINREKKGGRIIKQRKQKIQSLNKSEPWHDDTTLTSHYTSTNYLSTSMANDSNATNRFFKTSDSDFSDTESGSMAKINVTSGRVRQSALNLFLTTVKLAENNVMFTYWSNFIPENHTANTRFNLMTCILKDPSAKSRMTALNVLLQMLISSKHYLLMAEKGENLSFTPFSVVLGLMLKELHRCLCLALYENSVLVLTQVLKCLAALVQTTPYHRLHPGLIRKVIRNVKQLITHKDETVQVTALIVLGCCLASEPICAETKHAFVKIQSNKTKKEERKVDFDEKENVEFVDFSSSDDDDNAEEEEINQTHLPWLLEKCLSNLGVLNSSTSVVQTAVKLESLQIISVMSRNHFHYLILPHLNLITKALDLTLNDKYTNVKLYAGRAIDFLGQAINRCFTDESKQVTSEKFTVECLAFWQTLLNHSLPSLLQNEQEPTLRACACDCFGSIGPIVFEQLPRNKQILFITLLFGCSRDEDNLVRGAAIRALAICILYPSLRDDIGFVIDTAEAIYRVLQDDNLTVRIKSSWALGNFSNALVLNKNEATTSSESNDDLLPNTLILKLLKVSIQISNVNDKVKMNTVRAIGNLLQLISADLLKSADEFKMCVIDAFKVLVKNSSTGSNMKVRWNSCHALGNAMKNSDLFKVKQWQNEVWVVLMDLVMNSKNFKVRINAAVALASPTQRDLYGDYYGKIWSALDRALETSQNMDDFSEYKHRDHLVEEICLSLSHLITLLTKEDLHLIESSLNSDLVKVQMRKVWERLVPEKSSQIFQAHNHIANLLKSQDLTTKQKVVVTNLEAILKQDF